MYTNEYFIWKLKRNIINMIIFSSFNNGHRKGTSILYEMSNLNSTLLIIIGMIQMETVSYFIRTNEPIDEVFGVTIFFIVEYGILSSLYIYNLDQNWEYNVLKFIKISEFTK